MLPSSTTRQQRQRRAVLGPQPLWRHRAEPVDDRAQHREQQRLEHADRRGEQRHRGDVAAQAVAAGPHEGQETARRQRVRSLRIGLDQLLEKREHKRLQQTLADRTSKRPQIVPAPGPQGTEGTEGPFTSGFHPFFTPMLRRMRAIVGAGRLGTGGIIVRAGETFVDLAGRICASRPSAQAQESAL